MNMQPALLEVNGREGVSTMTKHRALISSIDHQIRSLLSLTGFLEMSDTTHERVHTHVRQRLGDIQTDLEVISRNIGRIGSGEWNAGGGLNRTAPAGVKNLKGGVKK